MAAKKQYADVSTYEQKLKRVMVRLGWKNMNMIGQDRRHTSSFSIKTSGIGSTIPLKRLMLEGR